jgi:hypothetical protein
VIAHGHTGPSTVFACKNISIRIAVRLPVELPDEKIVLYKTDLSAFSLLLNYLCLFVIG